MTTDRIVFDVDRDGWTKRLQLNIARLDAQDAGHGYRLAGPKYNGSSQRVLRAELDEGDAAEIRAYLDAVFPVRQAGDATISPEAAAHVLWHLYRDADGYVPGQFTSRLLAAWEAADHANASRLAAAFPAYGAALALLQQPHGRAELIRIARGGTS